MGRLRLRPRFKRQLPISAPCLMSAVKARLAQPGCGFEGTVLRRHVHVTVGPARRHLWSPHLSVDVLAAGDADRVMLRGRFGPAPGLWTGIMALYAVLAMLAIGGLVFGFSQWTLGWTPWALWAVPASGLATCGVLVAAVVGQRLSETQMHELNDFFEDCVVHASDPPDASGGGERDATGRGDGDRTAAPPRACP